MNFPVKIPSKRLLRDQVNINEKERVILSMKGYVELSEVSCFVVFLLKLLFPKGLNFYEKKKQKMQDGIPLKDTKG